MRFCSNSFLALRYLNVIVWSAILEKYCYSRLCTSTQTHTHTLIQTHIHKPTLIAGFIQRGGGGGGGDALGFSPPHKHTHTHSYKHTHASTLLVYSYQGSYRGGGMPWDSPLPPPIVNSPCKIIYEGYMEHQTTFVTVYG